MKLRWLEKRVPDSSRTEMVLQYEVTLTKGGGLGKLTYNDWLDVPIEKLPVEPRDADRVGPI